MVGLAGAWMLELSGQDLESPTAAEGRATPEALGRSGFCTGGAREQELQAVVLAGAGGS